MNPSEEDIRFLKEIFYVFDKGHDGDISCAEIKSLLSRFGFDHSLKDVDEMIQEKDLDQDGRINFDEFLKIITRDASSLDRMMEIKQAFELCDTKKDGKIDKNELMAYFKNIGIPLSEREAENMMRVADHDRSGFVELDEFIDIMSK